MTTVALYLLSVFTLLLAIGAAKNAEALRRTAAERDLLRSQLHSSNRLATYWQDMATQLHRHITRHNLPSFDMPSISDSTPFIDNPDWWKKGERFNGRNGRN